MKLTLITAVLDPCPLTATWEMRQQLCPVLVLLPSPLRGGCATLEDVAPRGRGWLGVLSQDPFHDPAKPRATAWAGGKGLPVAIEAKVPLRVGLDSLLVRGGPQTQSSCTKALSSFCFNVFSNVNNMK